MLIYQNHKQLKTNTSHDRVLSVTIHTGESGKKYWFSLFLLIKSKKYILLKIIFKFEHLTYGVAGGPIGLVNLKVAKCS
jgi:hypothetical protein